jgi:hypothetical protein
MKTTLEQEPDPDDNSDKVESPTDTPAAGVDDDDSKQKSKSHAGAIAGTIAAGTAIVGGVIAKKHHDHKEAEKKVRQKKLMEGKY